MGRGEGSARRRRERRLRGRWRHEQASVSAAVSALHHSCDVGPVLYEALRGHKKTTEGGGGGARGARRPTGTDGSVRRFAGLPSRPLACPYWGRWERQWNLALRFLAAALEDLRKLEEEKVKEKAKEEKLKMLEKEKAKTPAKEEKMQRLNDRRSQPLTQEEWAAWYRWNGIKPSTSSSSSGTKRKRKKWRRKRTRSRR